MGYTGCLYLEIRNMAAILHIFNYKCLFLCTFVCSLNSWIVKYVHLGAEKYDQKAVIVFEEDMGYLSRWHSSLLLTNKWNYTELPWRQLKGKIRCRTSYSFTILWSVWRNASCFGEYKEKHLFAHQLEHNFTFQTLCSLQTAHGNMKNFAH